MNRQNDNIAQQLILLQQQSQQTGIVWHDTINRLFEKDPKLTVIFVH